MASVYAQKERLKYLVKLLLDKYEVRCYFCGTEVDGLSFYRNLSGKAIDDVTVHHVDENRENNHKDNLVFSHRKCHLKHHRQKEEAIRQAKLKAIRNRVIIEAWRPLDEPSPPLQSSTAPCTNLVERSI
jgi:hypothetical protein